MALGLVGKKRGMTRVFSEDGVAVPVTVIEVDENVVTQIKTQKKDGYTAVQMTTGSRKPTRVNQALGGHFVKAGVQAGARLYEFLLTESELDGLALAKVFRVDIFEEGQSVDISGVTQGKGFAGTVKRHNFSTQDATHGNSLSHRAPGSIGQCQDPGRVFKGKKMAGHMGNRRCTVQNLKIIQINSDLNLLLVQGAVPGSKGQWVTIKPSVKRKIGRRV